MITTLSVYFNGTKTVYFYSCFVYDLTVSGCENPENKIGNAKFHVPIKISILSQINRLKMLSKNSTQPRDRIHHNNSEYQIFLLDRFVFFFQAI